LRWRDLCPVKPAWGRARAAFQPKRLRSVELFRAPSDTGAV
jgi:hypothetical protein